MCLGLAHFAHRYAQILEHAGLNFLSSLSLNAHINAAPGDCTITTSGSKVNFCVKAIRRTTFTNLDRVFTMKFLVRLS